MIPIPVAPKFVIQIVLFLVAVVGIASLFGIHSCQQKRKDKLITEHNNEKFDEKVSKQNQKLEVYQEQQKIINNAGARIKLMEEVYADKKCILENKHLTDKEIMVKCKRDMPALTPEQVREKTKEQLLELGGLL